MDHDQHVFEAKVCPKCGGCGIYMDEELCDLCEGDGRICSVCSQGQRDDWHRL